MRKSLWVAFLFVIAMALPVRAYANPLDSFSNGFDTLVNPKTEVKVDNGLPDAYVPQEVDLYSTQNERALPENPTTTDYINNTVDAFNKVPIFTGTRTLLDSVITFLGGQATSSISMLYMPLAIMLVFVWWGVRKSKQIIWTAFRTGRLNLGTSVKRAWYRRKAKEWYG